MVERTRRRVIALALAAAVGAVLVAVPDGRAQSADPSLRIVVLVGEGATNVLRQRVFVAPIVEVRDADDRPVAGVPVRFVVRDGRGAFLSGQTALTITTSAEGRAAIPGFEPTTTGPLVLDVTANARGRTASATITQTTVARVAGGGIRSTPRPASTATAIAGSGLRIVVIAGEDAVNVVQQQTAVAPIVEVRDRNDQPVAGALVRFAVRGGQGVTFGGESVVSVTTNAAGRAAASSFAPTSASAVHIEVSAAFQSQVATATISQTTVATAAEAAAASTVTASSTSATSGGGSGASGAAGGTGGGSGISGTTLAVAGGVAGAIGIVAVAKGGDDEPSGPQGLTLSGPVSSPWRLDYVHSTGETCTYTYSTTATARLSLQVEPRGDVSGTLELTDATTTVSTVCSTSSGTFDLGSFTGAGSWFTTPGQVTGTTGALTARNVQSTSTPDGLGGTYTWSWDSSFTGSLANGVVTGTLNHSMSCNYPGLYTCRGQGSAQVTLR